MAAESGDFYKSNYNHMVSNRMSASTDEHLSRSTSRRLVGFSGHLLKIKLFILVIFLELFLIPIFLNRVPLVVLDYPAPIV